MKKIHPTAARLMEVGAERGAKDFTEIAKSIGASDQSATNWKTRGVSKQAMIDASAFYGCSAAWLETGTGPKWINTPAPVDAGKRAKSSPILADLSNHDGLREVPRVRFKLSAGVSGFAIDVEEGNGKPIFFREDWFSANGYRPEKLFAVRINGQSMEPRLWDGDLVVINTADTMPHDGEPFAINYEGELVIKRPRPCLSGAGFCGNG